MISIITVFHNETYRALSDSLEDTIRRFDGFSFSLHKVDNRPAYQRGFATACNKSAKGISPTPDVFGFINPDAQIKGPFLRQIDMAFKADPSTVICGCRFNKPKAELDHWGVNNWVCGAAMFVRASWFLQTGGFDEQFFWSFEETDLIRRAEQMGKRILELDLPIEHQSPAIMPTHEAEFKSFWLNEGWARYKAKHKIKI
jgi:hypothetical protein